MSVTDGASRTAGGAAAAIASLNAAFAAAAARGDAETMAGAYAGDAVLLAPGHPAVRGRERIAAFWSAGVAAGLRSVDLETLSLDVRGDHAIEVGRATVRIEDADGRSVADRGKYVVVHRQGPDGWRWALDIFNSDGPDAPGT